MPALHIPLVGEIAAAGLRNTVNRGFKSFALIHASASASQDHS